MNDKQQLAAMGAQYRLTEEQAKGLAERMPQTGALQVIDDEPLCMAKRIEELKARIRSLEMTESVLRDFAQALDIEYKSLKERHQAALDRIEDKSNKLVWRNTGSPNGLRRFMTQKQYDAQTPSVQKWYEPIRYEVPEGWQLVPVELTENMLSESIDAGRFDEDDAVFFWAAMLASAPSPDSAK